MLFLRDRLVYTVDCLNKLIDLMLDRIKTAWVKWQYPYGVQIHIVGISAYTLHYEWMVANVEDHENSVWSIMQKHYYHHNNQVTETHYIGEFRFRRKTDAVNYVLCFN